MKYYMFFIILILFILINCNLNQPPKDVKVLGAHYIEGTDDVFYYGGTDHTDIILYTIRIDLDINNYSSEQFDEVDWTKICTAENNQILWGGGEGSGIIVPGEDFILRLQNPFDHSTDINKKIFFNDKIFTANSYSGGEFGTFQSIEFSISTKSKTINYSYDTK